jgi:molybdopterin-binding protein
MVDVDDTCVVVVSTEVVVKGTVVEVVAGTVEAAVEVEEGWVEVIELVESVSATPDISTDFALSLSDVS